MREATLSKTDPRALAAGLRRQFEQVERAIKDSRRHREHNGRHPGRIGALLGEADKYLQQAEWMLGAIPADRDNFADKVYGIGFENTLRLAHKSMLLAVLDHPIMVGEHTTETRRRGSEAVNQRSEDWHVAARLLKSLARHQDEYQDWIKPADLWPEFIGDLDNAGLRPRERSQPKRVEYGDGETMQYEAFRKAINRERDTAKR